MSRTEQEVLRIAFKTLSLDEDDSDVVVSSLKMRGLSSGESPLTDRQPIDGEERAKASCESASVALMDDGPIPLVSRGRLRPSKTRRGAAVADRQTRPFL